MADAALQARLAALQEENAYLRRQYDLDLGSEAVAQVQERLGLTRGEARIVCALYAASGRCVSWGKLADCYTEGGTMESVHVLIHRIRVKRGRGFVENVWGHGYRLGPDGMDFVRKLKVL